MKRTISIILVAALMLGFIAMTVSVASAEVIDTVAITGVTAPEVGQTATTEGIVCSNPNVTVEAKWFYLGAGQDRKIFEGTFENDRVYGLVLEIESNEGYEMEQEETVFTVDGSAPDMVLRFWGTFFKVYKVFALGDTETLTEVAFDSLPQISAGETIDTETLFDGIEPADGLQLDEDYTYMEMRTDEGWERVSQGTFEKTRYKIIMEVFAAEPNGWLNGVEAQSVTDEVNIASQDLGSVTVYYTVDLRDTVSQVEITNVKRPAVGEEFTTEGIQVTEGLEIVDPYWWNATEGEVVQPGEKMERDVEYSLNMRVQTKAGYILSDDVAITVGGVTENDDYDLSISNVDEDGFTVEWAHNVLSPSIPYVQVTGVPAQIEPGAVPTVDVESLHPLVEVTGAKWVDVNMQTPAAFEAGKLYALEVTAKAADGFRFTDWASMYTRQLKTGEGMCDVKEMTAYFVYSLEKPVKLEITSSGIAVGGKTEDVKINAPEGAEVMGVRVYDENYEPVQTFEAGKNYRVEFYMEPKDGYTFIEDDGVTVDGKEPMHSFVSTGYAYAELLACFGQKIDKVSLTLTEPKTGAEIAELKAPENANYEVVYSGWIDCHTGEHLWEGKFEDGHIYLLSANVVPKEGCYFTEDTVVLLNGAEPEGLYIDSTYVSLYQECSLAQGLEKVELPAWPTLEEGDQLKHVAKTTSADGKYTYRGYWVDADGVELDEGTVAQAGYIYTFLYDVRANVGYDVNKDTMFLAGGQELPYGQWMNYYGECRGVANRAYPIGLELVDTVELKVDELKIGEKAVASVTIGDEVYYLGDAAWEKGKTERILDAEEMDEDETFAYGYYYFLSIDLDIDQSHAFAQDVTVKINGKELEGQITYNGGDDLELYVVYNKLTDNPQTGDAFPVVAVVALMALAVAGLAVVIVGRKKFVK